MVCVCGCVGVWVWMCLGVGVGVCGWVCSKSKTLHCAGFLAEYSLLPEETKLACFSFVFIIIPACFKTKWGIVHFPLPVMVSLLLLPFLFFFLKTFAL